MCIEIESPQKMQPDFQNTLPSYYFLSQSEFVVSDSEFETLYGRTLPEHNSKAKRPYHSNHTLEDIKHTLVGKIIILYAKAVTKSVVKSEKEQDGMMFATIMGMPFANMVASGEGMLPENMMEGILLLLNGHYIKGLLKFVKK
jgi:beta-glucosidase